MDISAHFSYKNLLKYTFPSIVMMLFTSIYSVVDGLFVSNYAGKTAFAALNFIFPVLMLLNGTGFMFGSGGSALVAKTMGEGENEKANRIFSCLISTSVITGIALGLLGALLIKPVAVLLGAEGELLRNALIYGRIYILGMPFCIVQFEFQNLFVTAGKPKLGLYSSLISGLGNIVLDALFVVDFSWGLKGAAFATVLSQFIGGILPIIYFARPNSSPLRIVKTGFQGRAMLKICSNGASELLNNVSMTIVSMLYNIQLLRYAGENGLAAYGVIMYIDFLFLSMSIGYCVGVSPLISYNYGAENRPELKSLLRKSSFIIGLSSIVMFIVSEAMSRAVSGVFVGYDNDLYEMTLRGFLLYSFCFLFAGFSIFWSSFFTALNNGLISALLSFLRTILFEIAFVMLLPLIWGIDGIWVSTMFADFTAAVLGTVFMLANKKRYGY